MLFEFRFHPVKSFAELHEDPSKSVLIVLGDPHCLTERQFPCGLLGFVAQGGAVMIATDKATGAGSPKPNCSGRRPRDRRNARLHVLGIPARSLRQFALLSFRATDHEPATFGASKILGTLAATFGADGATGYLFRSPASRSAGFACRTNAPSRLTARSVSSPSGDSSAGPVAKPSS